MTWFKQDHGQSFSYQPPPNPPPGLPEWSASVSKTYANGLYSDAPEDEYQAGEAFCATHPVEAPRLLSSHIIQSVREQGYACWGLAMPVLSRFKGIIANVPGVDVASSSGTTSGLTTVKTAGGCGDTCIFSNLPIIGGLYQSPPGLRGVYYEVKVHLMEGVIAIGETKSYSPYQ
jgi:hypothetical protein